MTKIIDALSGFFLFCFNNFKGFSLKKKNAEHNAIDVIKQLYFVSKLLVLPVYVCVF